MIYQKGDLSLVSNGVIVHGCNAQGKMNSGVAKAIRAKYPQCFTQYEHDLNQGVVWLGDVSWWGKPDNSILIASAITQESYGRDKDIRYVSYDAIDAAFDLIFTTVKPFGKPIHMPKIGAGLGNGEWNVIELIIENKIKKTGFDYNKVFVWELE